MGNRGLICALHRFASSRTVSGVPFGQIILAPPDIDQDVIVQLAGIYRDMGERTTICASPGYHALALSRWLHTYPRAGFTPPVTIVPDVDTVEVPSFNILDLGHGYF